MKLLKRKDLTLSQLNTLIKKANTALAKTEGRISDNTGFYDGEAVARLQRYVDASTLPEEAAQAQIAAAYYTLQAAYDDFMANGLNAARVMKLSSAADLPNNSIDLTVEKLIERDNFSRTDASTTRFGKPVNWTVENFQIPNGGDGTKNGLDRYPGQDALMLGVWDDRGNNKSGSLANARIYRKVTLAPGRYYFGASYNANHQLYKAYIFASDQLLTTAKIPTQALAYADISQCGMDGQFYGIVFTLTEEQEVYLGFQANLASGSATQEFRADGVRLLSLDTDQFVGIREISQMEDGRWKMEDSPVYDLSGRRVQSSIFNLQSQKGIYIEHRAGTTRKVLRK